MGSADYLLESRWKVPAGVGAVYAALVDVASYPAWWPQVRQVRRIDDASGELTCRSCLPYDLVFVVRREIEDADGHVLQARPVLRFNHDVMMREGERGLRRHLAGQAATPTVDG